MRKTCLVLFMLTCLGAVLSHAVEPADSVIKHALADIERYEKQFAGKTSASAASVKRTLKLLDLTRERLDGSQNKGHASWQEAAQRYNSLVAHLNSLMGASSGSSSSASAQAPASEKKTQLGGQSGSPSAQMISHQRVQIKRIARDIESRIDTMNKAGVLPFQDSEYVRKREETAAAFVQSLSKFASFQGDPDVVAAGQKLAEYQNMVAFGKQEAAKALAEVGDVQARLKKANEYIRSLKMPQTPQQPYKPGQISEWLTELAKTRQAAEAALPVLNLFKTKAYLPNNRFTPEQGAAYDYSDVVRFENTLVGLTRSIDEELRLYGANVPNLARHVRENLDYYASLDPTDRDQQAKHFLQEGRADEIRQRLAQDSVTAKEIADYGRLVNAASKDEYASLVSSVRAATDQYEAGYQTARSLIRMPDAASTDAKLLKIARETMANYDYIGKAERVVINADKVHRTKETSTEKFDDLDVSIDGTITLTGTKTTYFYEWDQFQVATAEAFNGKHYIFYTTLKYFTSGSTTTPLNKWVVGNRIQGAEIPRENISK